MSSNQFLMVILGLVLFSILLLSRGENSLSQLDRKLQSDAAVVATGVGQSIIERMNGLAFDEATINKDTLSNPNSLSTTLSYDSGEDNIFKYDDIDDFNNYIREDSIASLGSFKTKINVSYGSTANPYLTSSTKTFYKKIYVATYNKYLLQDSIRFTVIRGY